MSLSLNEFLQSEIIKILFLIRQFLIGSWYLHHYDAISKEIKKEVIYSLHLEHNFGI